MDPGQAAAPHACRPCPNPPHEINRPSAPTRPPKPHCCPWSGPAPIAPWPATGPKHPQQQTTLPGSRSIHTHAWVSNQESLNQGGGASLHTQPQSRCPFPLAKPQKGPKAAKAAWLAFGLTHGGGGRYPVSGPAIKSSGNAFGGERGRGRPRSQPTKAGGRSPFLKGAANQAPPVWVVPSRKTRPPHETKTRGRRRGAATQHLSTDKGEGKGNKGGGPALALAS